MSKWVGVFVALVGCDGAGLDLSIEVTRATFSQCNSVIIGFELEMSFDNISDAAIQVVEVRFEADDHSVEGASRDIAGGLVESGDTATLKVVANSCIDPLVKLSTPTAAEVPMHIEVDLHDTTTDESGTFRTRAVMTFAQTFDNCRNVGTPGEGCAP